MHLLYHRQGELRSLSFDDTLPLLERKIFFFKEYMVCFNASSSFCITAQKKHQRIKCYSCLMDHVWWIEGWNCAIQERSCYATNKRHIKLSDIIMGVWCDILSRLYKTGRYLCWFLSWMTVTWYCSKEVAQDGYHGICTGLSSTLLC